MRRKRRRMKRKWRRERGRRRRGKRRRGRRRPPPHPPYAVQHVAVLGDAQQLVVRGDLVEVGALLVGEEEVGLPDGFQHGRVQVQRLFGVLAVGQAGVVPLLPQEDVHPVVLGGGGDA